MRTQRRERGAAAVEFALLLPVLLLLVGGIIDFGRAYYTQVVLTNAAREGARTAVVLKGQTAPITARAQAAAPGLPGVAVNTGGGCPASGATTATTVTVTTSVVFNWTILGSVTGLFGAPLPAKPMSASATMGCL